MQQTTSQLEPAFTIFTIFYFFNVTIAFSSQTYQESCPPVGPLPLIHVYCACACLLSVVFIHKLVWGADDSDLFSKCSSYTPRSHYMRPLTDLIDFVWGALQLHCRSVRSVGSVACVKKLRNIQLFRQRRMQIFTNTLSNEIDFVKQLEKHTDMSKSPHTSVIRRRTCAV